MKIKEEVLKVLSNCRVEGNKVFLPNVQLDRKLYVEVNKTLESIGLVWNRKEKSHISAENIEQNFEDMILTGEYTDKKKELNYFPTPLNIVNQMIELAELKSDDFVLEPSAGTGHIANEIYKITNKLDLIEIDPVNCEVLRRKFKATVLNIDFLSFNDSVRYDKIVMNPPFSVKGHNQCELSHILHAWEFLKKDGILVSIVSESPFFRENSKSVEFREWLEENNAETIKLPDGAFSESGTNVKCRMLKIIKK